VNCGSRSNLLYIAITVYFYSHCLLSRILLLLSTRYAQSFVYNKPVRLTTHRKLGEKFLVVLCAGSTLLLVQSKALNEAPYKLSGAVAKLAGITF
jgi:hypothetical protein